MSAFMRVADNAYTNATRIARQVRDRQILDFDRRQRTLVGARRGRPRLRKRRRLRDRRVTAAAAENLVDISAHLRHRRADGIRHGAVRHADDFRDAGEAIGHEEGRAADRRERHRADVELLIRAARRL